VINLTTVLGFIQVGGALLPEGLALVNEIKALFGEQDVAVIDQALADSDAAADLQHTKAQEL
jgi:hypothetical protein